jgi:hypothetical protein
MNICPGNFCHLLLQLAKHELTKTNSLFVWLVADGWC